MAQPACAENKDYQQAIPTPAELNAPPIVPPEIEAILALPEDKIDIGLAALAFAHDVYPDDTDIQKYSKRIDDIAAEVRALKAEVEARHLPTPEEPDNTILALREVFYEKEGFAYDHAADAQSNALDLFLPGLIERKRGICTTMPMLFMAVAQRLGVQMYVGQTIDHNFLRIKDPRTHFENWEATSGGPMSNARLIKESHVRPEEIKSGAFMRTLTHHQVDANAKTQ